MSGYALDTNIISFLLRKDQRLQTRVYNEANGGAGVSIPAIAYYETKRGLIDHHATEKLVAFERLCGLLGVDTLDMAILDKAAGIYAILKKSGRIIDDADILIAASCLANGHTLVTNNKKHFERVEGLQFVDWTEQTNTESAEAWNIGK